MSHPQQKQSFFMLVKATRAWLSLTPKERFAYLQEKVVPILQAHPQVTMRFFDAEAFCARYSDIILWETQDTRSYQSLIEGLRETTFWDHYFAVLEIIPAIEDAYALHYEVSPLQASTSPTP
ncbi:MAG: darcynin [Myxococcales bacterium]|nr:darcynin [Myxococcales bacterium]MCB9641709.1 darcynin [Myxococcales bacterium]